MNRIKELENKIFSYEKFEDYKKLIDELRELDPYNDMFHLTYPSWPNCDIGGCEKSDWL